MFKRSPSWQARNWRRFH